MIGDFLDVFDMNASILAMELIGSTARGSFRESSAAVEVEEDEEKKA